MRAFRCRSWTGCPAQTACLNYEHENPKRVSALCEACGLANVGFEMEEVEVPEWNGEGWECRNCEAYNSSLRKRCRFCATLAPVERDPPAVPPADPLRQSEGVRAMDAALGFAPGTLAAISRVERLVGELPLAQEQQVYASALWRSVNRSPSLAGQSEWDVRALRLEEGGRTIRVDLRALVPGTSEPRGAPGPALSILGTLEDVLERHEGGTAIDGNTLRGLRNLVENLREALGVPK